MQTFDSVYVRQIGGESRPRLAADVVGEGRRSLDDGVRW
jgi:hypothetical protein